MCIKFVTVIVVSQWMLLSMYDNGGINLNFNIQKHLFMFSIYIRSCSLYLHKYKNSLFIRKTKKENFSKNKIFSKSKYLNNVSISSLRVRRIRDRREYLWSIVIPCKQC